MIQSVLRFQFDEKKGVEALTYIANQWPGITPFFASKVLYFAEKWHLNRYARPIVADTFIAMPNGPVPSTLYDFIKGNLTNAGDPEAFFEAIQIDHDRFLKVSAKRTADQEVLSPSDLECLNEAIEFCRQSTFGVLSSLTHREHAWLEADINGPMSYEAMVERDHPNRSKLIEELEEFAAYGVL
jgi:uncharacterized phage-associated protein